jgi:hypothetical protein
MNPAVKFAGYGLALTVVLGVGSAVEAAAGLIDVGPGRPAPPFPPHFYRTGRIRVEGFSTVQHS